MIRFVYIISILSILLFACTISTTATPQAVASEAPTANLQRRPNHQLRPSLRR